MNIENSKTNQPHRFRLTFVNKLNLNHPNKNMALVNLSITHGKILHLYTKRINLNICSNVE